MSWPVPPGSPGRSGPPPPGGPGWGGPPASGPSGWGGGYPAGDPGWDEPDDPAWHDRGRPGPWRLAAVVLLLAAVAALYLGLRGNHDALAGLPPAASGGPVPAPKVVVPPVGRSIPVRLNVPAIGLKVALSELGRNPDGTVEVPSDFQEPGWYRLGPSPGQVGSAVILGHIDSYLGPAVFFRLRYLRPGDHVNVTLADGLITHFVVRKIAMYPKTDFPDLLVYGSHGYSGLQLVTCGGVFDTQTRNYLSNVVVYTALTAVS